MAERDNLSTTTSATSQESKAAPIWQEEILNIPRSGDPESLTHSAPAPLIRLGAVCEGVQKVKLDAIQSILTDGKWLFQTAMTASEMQEIQQVIQEAEPAIILEDMDAESASLHFRNRGFLTVDSLKIPMQHTAGDDETDGTQEREEPEEGEIIVCDSEPDSCGEEELATTGTGPDCSDKELPVITVQEGTSERVIIFDSDEETAWKTWKDTHASDITPPPRKRTKVEYTASDSPGLAAALEAAQIKHAIRVEGIRYRVSEWKLKNRGVSLHILHDGLLRNWPDDKKCVVTEASSSLKVWGDKIRSAQVRLCGHTVIVVLQGLREVTVPSILKNKISNFVHAAWSARHQIRVYFADALPSVGHKRVIREKFIEHDRLTRLGCLHYRANLFREVGLTSYHDL